MTARNSTVYCVRVSWTADPTQSRAHESSRRCPMCFGECENVDHRLSRRFRLDLHPALPAPGREVCSLVLNLNLSRLLAPPLFSFFCSSPTPLPSPRHRCERVRECERERAESRPAFFFFFFLHPNLRPRTRPLFPFPSLPLRPPVAPARLCFPRWAGLRLYCIIVLSYLTLF